MSSSNRLRVSSCAEVTLGSLPGSARMRTTRITGESLTYDPTFIQTDEIRSDRMVIDPIESIISSGGGINFELSYPEDGTTLSDILKSALYNSWSNTPTFDNDGTADSVVTDAGTTADTYVVASGGASVKAGHLVRATGFTNSANNQIFKVASSSGTTIVGSGLSLTAETAPPGTAKLKVVGFQGASGDITASSTGLASTSLDFTTLGLFVGQWVKIGGTAAGDKFATAALNTWVRITAIAAHALTMDNLPSGWTTDAGTGKTLKCWIGDRLVNGTTQSSLSIEKAFLDQGTPTYILYNGMVANTLALNFASKQKVTGSVTFMGMGASQGTSANGASYDAASTNAVMAANANVGRLAEGGSALTSPNWASDFSVSLTNNAASIEAVDSQSPVSIVGNELNVTGKLTSYFGDNTLLAKFYAGTATSLSVRVTKNSQAVIVTLPRVTYTGSGNPQASGKNVQVALPLDYTASYDSTTGAMIYITRVPYFEI